VNDPRGRDLDGTTVIVGPGAAATGHRHVPACMAGAPLPGRADLVIGECGHPMDGAEWDAAAGRASGANQVKGDEPCTEAAAI